MATPRESGHYALAGFLYQLIGSGVEAFEIAEGSEDNDKLDRLLLLERFGQDAVEVPCDGSGRKPRLVQYKYSSTGSEIKPSELRTILESLLKSVRGQNLAIDQVEYALVTNRRYSRDVERWVAARERADNELERLIGKSSKKAVADLAELASIFRLIEYETRTLEYLKGEIVKAARQFGILDDEIDGRIDALIGFLLQKASAPGPRIIRAEELHKAFTGYDKPYRLLSPESARVRLDDLEHYKRDETGGKTTIARAASTEIFRSVLEHPLTVVVGDGGVGKTVAACDAVGMGLRESDEPPGFGFILQGACANSESVMNRMARWRNLSHHADGQEWRRSIKRLRGAFADNPLLVICVDAIDEKVGNARLPDDAQRFVRELIWEAFQNHTRSVSPMTSIILTCRRRDELDNLPRSGFGFPEPYEHIEVSDFDDDEVKLLADELDRGVSQRIVGHMQIQDTVTGRMPSRPLRPTSAAVLKAIRHPVLWRFFSALDVPVQHACLDDKEEALDQLGVRYLEWFRSKAESRLNALLKGECVQAIKAVSLRFQGEPGRIGKKGDDWLIPCQSAGCRELHALQLLDEAMTAGVLVEDERGGQRWRWKHPWFCEYLCRTGANER